MQNRFKSLLIAGVLMVPAWAQESGTLRMLIDPGHDFSFIVDHKHRLQQREVKLTEGLHHFSIWAPERVVVDTIVFVIADRTTDLLVQLPYSGEFVQYRKDLGAYQTKKRWVRSTPMLALAGGLIWTGVSIGRYGKAKKALDADRDNYAINVDPATILTLKNSTIPQHNDDLKSARSMLYIASAFTAVSAAATYYFYQRTAKWERPLFEDKEKVKFDGMVWLPGERGGLFMAGLTIDLSSR